MRKLGWIALGVIVLSGSGNLARAQDVRYRITPKPAPPAPVVGASMQAPEAPWAAPAEPQLPNPLGPACAATAACASCPDCKGQGKLRRLADWLCYRPLPSKCKSCQNEPYCRPPLYAFFPCQGGNGGCGGCANGAAMPPAAPAPMTLYFTKAADAPASDPITQTGFPDQLPVPGKEVSSATPTKESEYHPTTYKPANIAKTMPVLPPSLFRAPQPAGSKPNSCPAPQK